jgi:hypothetical protein
MFNFIDDNEKFQLFTEGKLCLTCMHKAHCGNGCYVEDDDTCDCFECGCPKCKQHIG